MEVLLTFEALLKSYVTNFYPFLVIHALLLAWFWWVLSCGLRSVRVESDVLQRLKGAQPEQMDDIVAECEGRSRVARTLLAILSTARTMSTVDVSAKTVGVTEPLRQAVATGTTIANLFLISGVLGTLVGMYQGAEAATAGASSSLARILSGAFHAFGVTVVAILCAGFVLLVVSSLRQRAPRFQEMVALQAERFLQLHKGEMAGELARRLSRTVDKMSDLFETESRRLEDAEGLFRTAIHSLSALLEQFGGFQEVTAQMGKSVADLGKLVKTTSSKMSEALATYVKTQEAALNEGLAAQQASWNLGLESQEAILQKFVEVIKTTLDEAALKHQKAVNEAREAMTAATTEAARTLAAATSSSASMLADAEQAAEVMIGRSAESYKSMLEQVLASVLSVKTQVEKLDASFAEVATKAGEHFRVALANIEFQMRRYVEEAIQNTTKLDSTWKARMDGQAATIEHVIQTETRAFVEAVRNTTAVMTKGFSESLATLQKQLTATTALVESVAGRLDTVQRGMKAPGDARVRLSDAWGTVTPTQHGSEHDRERPPAPEPKPEDNQERKPEERGAAKSADVQYVPPFARREEGRAGIPDQRGTEPSVKQEPRAPIPLVPKTPVLQNPETTSAERLQAPRAPQGPTWPPRTQEYPGAEQRTAPRGKGIEPGGDDDDKKGTVRRLLSRVFHRSK